MSCHVITYTNPKDIEQLSGFWPYKDALHVCATKNMREGVYERYQKRSVYIRAPIITSIQLIEGIIGEWCSSKTKLKQYLYLSEIIRNDKDIDVNLSSSFKRNKTDILDTIRLLEFSGVTPSSLEDEQLILTQKEEAFLSVWKRFESDEFTQSIRKLLKHGIKDILLRDWNSIIKKIIDEAYDEQNSISDKIKRKIGYETIVCHGFYFMTPEQQQVFTLLKKAGVKIVFLNLYNNRYPETFSFIERFINKKHGWLDKEAWDMEPYSTLNPALADKFLMDYEGEKLEEYTEHRHLKVRDFDDFHDFLDDYEKSINKNKELVKTYLAPNADSLNNRLQEYYPEMFKNKRHFLSFPIGQFFYHLHEMWSENDNSFVITEKGLFESFASGWVYDNKTGKNAFEYTKELSKILPFFKGCITKKSWIERGEKLLEIGNTVLPEFEKQDDNYFKEVIASPLSLFSQFSISMEDTAQVIQFIQIIFKIAHDLFGNGNNRINLNNHFLKLKILLDEQNPYIEKKIVKQERILINQLKETLGSSEEEWDFHIGDISAAVNLYLGGHLKNDLNSNDEVIKPFIEIDGEVFKDKQITHVTGLDQNSLPYSEFKLPWPLTSEVFEYLGKRTIPLSFQILRNDAVKEITRYLFYNLLQFSDRLELSWMIQNGNDKNLKKAIYLSQLGLEPEPKEGIDTYRWKDIKIKNEVTQIDIDPIKEYSIDALAEFELCPRRFYYSYISGDREAFASEFVQEFLFSNIIKTFKVLLPGITDEKLKRTIYGLFPYWDEFKLDLNFENNTGEGLIRWLKYEYGGHTSYDGYEEFSNLRKIFLFPSLNNNNDKEGKLFNKRIEELYENFGSMKLELCEEFQNQLKEHPVQMEATPSYHCRFCPHSDVCADVYHPIDDSGRKIAK